MKKEKRTFGTVLMILMILFFYLPIIYSSFYSNLALHSDTPNDLGLYTYSLNIDSNFIYII